MPDDLQDSLDRLDAAIKVIQAGRPLPVPVEIRELARRVVACHMSEITEAEREEWANMLAEAVSHLTD